MKKALRVGSTLWLHCDGRTYTMNLQSEETERARVTVTADGVLRSPMPGKVLKIAFKKGDAVKSGDTVCVLEAMKMEYNIKAPFDGKIKEVYKTVNAPVQLDEKIAEIEAK